MKNKFEQYFPSTEKEIKKLWQNCVFIFDTSALLDLYRYSENTKKEFIELLEKIKDKIWLPNQVALEFLKNRLDVIITQENIFIKTIKLLDEIIERADSDINKNLNFRHHPAIEKIELFNKIKSEINKIKVEIEDKQKKHQDLMKKDEILEKISKIFENLVGEEYDEKRIEEIYKIGSSRYKNKIPPGYEDAIGDNKKEGNDIYGDLVIWLQIIDYAKSIKKNIIFISNDSKEDWWWIKKGKTIGCRPELKGELKKEANVEFHMYNTDRFLHYAKINLDLKINEKSIDEVKEIRIKQREVEDQIKFDLNKYLTPNSILKNLLSGTMAMSNVTSPIFKDSNSLSASNLFINELSKNYKKISDEIIASQSLYNLLEAPQYFKNIKDKEEKLLEFMKKINETNEKMDGHNEKIKKDNNDKNLD